MSTPTKLEAVRRIPFKSKSNPANNYECLVHSDGSLSCNCRGWTFAKNGVRECKHTLVVEQMLDVENAGGNMSPLLPPRSVAPGKVSKAPARKFDTEM